MCEFIDKKNYTSRSVYLADVSNIFVIISYNYERAIIYDNVRVLLRWILLLAASGNIGKITSGQEVTPLVRFI